MMGDPSATEKRCASPRVHFVNRFYFPDISATSQILTDVAEAVCRNRFPVCVFTSRTSYGGDQLFKSREKQNGVEIYRIWSTRFGRQSTIGRMIDYLSFYISVSIAILFTAKRGDVIVAKTDPPLLSIPLGLIAKVRGAKLVNWLQDIFPEVATELGLGRSDGLLLGALARLRNRSLYRARMNVVIGTKMAACVRGFSIPQSRISFIHNFVDDDLIRPSDEFSPELRLEWGFSENDFIIGYSGNLGRAHDLETMLDAAETLKHEPAFKFLFVGGGHLRQRLENEVEVRKLSNVFLRPYQPRERLVESLALPNLHWASLVPSLEGYIVPSKIYGVAAAGRPLIMIGDSNGEVGELIAKYQFGVCIPVGDDNQLRNFIVSARDNRQLTASMGREARRFIEKKGSRNIAIQNWNDLLSELLSTD